MELTRRGRIIEVEKARRNGTSFSQRAAPTRPRIGRSRAASARSRKASPGGITAAANVIAFSDSRWLLLERTRRHGRRRIADGRSARDASAALVRVRAGSRANAVDSGTAACPRAGRKWPLLISWKSVFALACSLGIQLLHRQFLLDLAKLVALLSRLCVPFRSRTA